MSDIKKHVIELYNSISDEKTTPISEDSVQDAVNIVNEFNFKTMGALLVFLSALNLLNAAIKMDAFRHMLSYRYIKTNVSRVADFILSHKNINVSVYYNTKQKCIYFSIFDIVFSFHQINETTKIISIAANSMPITWTGIRLQQIALPLFEYAKMINSSETEEKIDIISTDNDIDNQYMSLISCPCCGKQISQFADFCPNCGFSYNKEKEIASDIPLGTRIQLESNGATKVGKVVKKESDFISVLLDNGTSYRVKYSAISSISVLPSIIEEESTSFAFDQSSAADMLVRLYELESISLKASIQTNATIKNNSNPARIMVIADEGNTFFCCRPVGFHKIRTKVGVRLYCLGKMEKVCFSSIIEMTYSKLGLKLLKAIRSYNNHKIKHSSQLNHYAKILSTILSYFKEICKNEASFIILAKIQKVLDSPELLFSLRDGDESKLRGGSESSRNAPEQLLTISEPQVLEEMANAKPEKKLELIENAKSNKIFSEELPSMPELECRQVEKELDSMTREGKRVECLSKSYQIITTRKPTPKYLKSYLDRIVNTEIALDHTEQARDALSILIAFCEAQEDTKPNNLSHLYVSLARLLIKLGNSEDAILALDWAKFIFPQNKKGIDKIRQKEPFKLAKSPLEHDAKQVSQVIVPEAIVSGMLIQDVEQYAKSQSVDSENSTHPFELYKVAESVSSDKNKSFEIRAQMFLDAAVSYLNASLTTETEFKLSVAHYARLKGDSRSAKIAEYVQQYPDSQSHIIAECDSARSYYLEALGLYNDLAQKKYLQELLLKYLKIESLVSQIEGGRTPDADWNKGSLNERMKECLNGGNVESQRVLYQTCISIGSTVERAWNTLSNDKDGIGPLYWRFKSSRFRNKAYQLINTIEKSNIPTTLAPGEFLRRVFENRKMRNKKLKEHLDNCMTWDFDQFDIASFETKWKALEEFKDLMTSTDKLTMNSIDEVINILKPYAGNKDDERYRNLVGARKWLEAGYKTIKETTTYYGRIFFSHLQEKWLKEIENRIEERDARALPRLLISPEPCYIKLNDDGQGIIDFVVTNNGDSTAQSFVVLATINGKEYVVSHEEELSAGDTCGESIVSNDFCDLETADIVFKITAKYQGKDLPTIEFEASYEIESGDFLTDEEQIPWIITNTPEETIFKGREEDLFKLISHYLSKDRGVTYILYGLTRTGKSSILEYFCKRIEGKHIRDDKSKSIMTFIWDFGDIDKTNPDRSELWSYLLETKIYDILPDELVDAIEAEYPEKGFPSADRLSYSDLEIIINALNKCNIVPLIAIDEFSYIRNMFKNKVLDITFIKKLREIAFSGKACFLYAGTYDIKDIPKEYGETGEMNSTMAMRINEIKDEYANELMDVCPYVIFKEKAKELIRVLSGCIPFWIQWICLACGKFAIAYRHRYLGRNDVDYVVKILTGEILPGPKDTWSEIEEINFYNNQIDKDNIPEHQLISSITHIIEDSTNKERGVSVDELNHLWDRYNVSDTVRRNMIHALDGLVEKRILKDFRDETRVVYKLNVGLFRRWWFAHHRDLKRDFNL